MAETTTLGGAVDFFRDLGLFDVVLPFILVFTLIFAILEKTRILGHEGGDKNTPKKNLNSLVALVVALLTIAVNTAVNFINVFFQNLVLIIVAFLGFLLVIGLFRKDEEFGFASSHENWYKAFVGLIFVGLIFVVLNSIETGDDETILENIWNWLKDNLGDGVIGGVIVLVLVALVLFYATKTPKQGGGG